MSKELERCPFCGGKVSIAQTSDESNGLMWFYITRGDGENVCDCRVFMEGRRFNPDLSSADEIRQELIDRWNHRVENIGNKWFDVRERMPDAETDVIVHCKNGRMFAAQFTGSCGYDNKPIWFVFGPLGSGRKLSADRITHWTPMVRPPIEVQK